MPKSTSTRKGVKGVALPKAILVLHGPNLNLLGSREPQHYGRSTLEDIDQALKARGDACGVSVESFQSNHEGALVDRVQQAKSDGVDFILINPGGYTHTSVALRDALAAVGIPFVEVHLSNVHARESFRRHSYFSDLAIGVIAGLGAQGYELALEFALRHLHVKVTSHGSQKTEKTH
jgi:3-dehydroquinate dehydratase-2